MLVLGPVGEGTRREQCRKWLVFLDAAKLEWWRVECFKSSIKMARARVDDGERPPTILENACHEGMRRLACAYPFVQWAPGPWDCDPRRRVVGLWPQRRQMARAVLRGIIGEWCVPLRRDGEGRVGQRKKQRYWLHVEERAYQLHELYGKAIWRIEGKWSHV